MFSETLPTPLLEKSDRIVALWIGRLGDLIITTPFLRSLRLRFPKAEIILIVPAGATKQAARLIPDVDHIAILGSPWDIASHARLARTLLFRHSDILIDLNSAPSKTSAILSLLARARVKLSFDKHSGAWVYTHRIAAPSHQEHMLDRYGRLAKAIGAPYDPTPRLQLGPADVKRARDILRDLGIPDSNAFRIVIHPGNFKKFDNRWPEPNFAEITNRLLDLPGLQILYLAGPGEERAVAGIVSQLKRSVPVIPPLPLGITAGVLSQMNLFFGNATGTAHLAAAVGTPTLAVLGGYTKAVWMPCEISRGAEGTYERPVPGVHRHFQAVSSSWESCRDVPVETVWQKLGDCLQALRGPSVQAQQRSV